MKFLFCIVIFLMTFGISQAQDLRFTYNISHSGNTSSITVSVYNSGATPENLTGFTVNLYYDQTESTLTGFDNSPTTNLGWINSESSTLHVSNNNPAIISTHTGFGTINVIDEAITGTNIGLNPVPILIINFDNTPGTPSPSPFYAASTAENHPALEYVGNDFVGHPMIVQPATFFPVELLEFKAEAQKNRTSLLAWTTATELNNEGFFIERIGENQMQQEWKELGYVVGNGTTNETQTYKFIDPSPLAGENVYRLRQVDINGSFSYSKTRSVLFDPSVKIQVYPNPAQNHVNIRFEDQSAGDIASFQLYDKAGKTLQSGILNVFELNQINLARLPEGTYILSLTHNGLISKENIVKIN